MSDKWFYIQWHNDTHNRPQMQDVIMEFGWESYGIYVALSEILHKNGGELPIHSLKSVAWTLHISPDRLREFVEKYISVGVMDVTDDVLFSYELKNQFGKQKNAVAAARIRWDKKKSLPKDDGAERAQQQPQAQQQQQQNAPTELTDSQKESIDILVNKLKYTSDKAERIAREYEHDYIIEKIDYLMEMIKKNNNIRSPHVYFEKALQENWVSSSAIIPEKATPAQKISFVDVDVQRFVDNFKQTTGSDFPQELRGKLKEVIKDKESEVVLALDIVKQNYNNVDFFSEINIERNVFSDGKIFLNRQIVEKIVEYWRQRNTFTGKSLDDIINEFGVEYGSKSRI